jgi:hypothetical protein
LGQTSPNPVQSTLQNFRKLYEARLQKPAVPGQQVNFDLLAALQDAITVQGRQPVQHQD